MGSNHTCLAVISLDSAFKKDESYYPKAFLKKCKCIEKKGDIYRHIILYFVIYYILLHIVIYRHIIDDRKLSLWRIIFSLIHAL